MALQIPCITSPLANNAIGATDGENIFIASSPHQYAEKIILLLEDPVLARSIAEKGNEFVKKNYTWKKSIGELENILTSLANGNKGA
jgi:glycosyltransferase involved in cell wall biosynthesis